MLVAALSIMLFGHTTALSLPYIPTTAFVSSTNATSIYVFEASDDATSASLISIDSSRAITSNFAATTISSSLPFLSNDSTSAFNPIIDDSGDLYVFSGDCSKGSADTSLWTLKDGSDARNGQWTRADITTRAFDDATSNGVNYLSTGFAFAAARNKTPTLYSFGGMCPNASTTTLTSSTWQAAANYSRSLFQASPLGVLSTSSFASISSNLDTFRLAPSTANTRGPPVAEAGFSVTALPASYSGANDSSVQQNFVFIGGHTAQAFINVSQVALLSLPEQSWSFLPVENPGSVSGELVKRDNTAVEPRSGHTAVLSEDGTKVVVFGGWVGDINTPAVPQLAILSVGSGYGGNGDWQWSVPTTQGPTPSGNGIYGHGAVMLPGNTMMIIGGSTISGQGSKRKRAVSQASFFNISSSRWVTEYQNPLAQPPSDQTASDTTNSHRGRSIGLGVGLGLGIPLFFLALCLLFCCLRRKHKRDKRERTLERETSHQDQQPAFSSDGEYDPGETAMMERHRGHDSYPWAAVPTDPPAGEHHEGGWRNMRSMEAERTGLLVEIPSPTRGLRRSMQGRSNTYYEDGRSGRQSDIHVIDELEEPEPHDGDLGTAQQRYSELRPHTAHTMTPASRPTSSYRLPEIRSSPPILDPFVDPLGAHPIISSGTVSPITPSPNEDHEREDGGWIEDWEALNTRISDRENEHVQDRNDTNAPSAVHMALNRVSPDSSRGRRSSPIHSDRTTSTLSEKSMHSAVSYVSNSSKQSGVSLRHNPSQRSTNLFSVRQRNQSQPVRRSLPASGTVATAVATLEGTPPQQSKPGDRGHARNESGDSTTRSPGLRLPSFGTLRAESQALLGRSAETPATHLGHTTNIEASAAGDYVDADEDDEFPRRPNQRRSRGLMGSVRSALSRGRGRANSSSPTNQMMATSPTVATFPGSSPSRSGTNTPFSLLRSVTSEPEAAGSTTRRRNENSQHPTHQRTDSSGSGLWNKRHSGARDWDWRQGGTGAQPEDPVYRRSGSDENKQGTSSSSLERRTITESLRDDASDDWDVEGAIETRRVQVMFTVPRERLRVVNAMDGDAESVIARQDSTSGEDEGKSRATVADDGEQAGAGQAEPRYFQEAVSNHGQSESSERVKRGRYEPGRGSPWFMVRDE